MDAEKLEELGWSVYPGMLVKEQQYPYSKCVAAVKKGKISKVYWSFVKTPKRVKKKFLDELKKYG